MDATWQKSVICPVCEAEFTTENVRQDAIRVKGRDTDFMVYYEGINPNLYLVWVCPKCYYAALRDDFQTLTKKEQKILQDTISKRFSISKMADFTKERDEILGILSYELAGFCYEQRKSSNEKLASIYLREAWVAREIGDWDVEHECLEKSSSFYKKAFYEDYDLKMAKSEIMYLIGEISRRLGNYEEAISYLAKVFEDKGAKQKIADLAHNQYYLAKKDLEELREGVSSGETSHDELLEIVIKDAAKDLSDIE
ncbi:MAG: DUF2225 domain-containing protein [bacterium]|nr:DUF2225 domain-containing protein [bacterium]